MTHDERSTILGAADDVSLRSKRYARVVRVGAAVALLLTGAFITLSMRRWGEPPQAVEIREVVPRNEELAATRETPALRPPPVRATGETPSARVDQQMVRVRTVQRSDQTPVSASVRVALRRGQSVLGQGPIEADVIDLGETDMSGLLLLPFADTPRWVIASSSGFATQSAILDPGVDLLTIELEVGYTISGVVWTASDKPVPGVDVGCRPSGEMPDVVAERGSGHPFVSTSVARTDESGAFTIEGLAAGAYSLHLRSLEWSITGADRPYMFPYAVPTGSQDVVLRVRPLRWARFRLIDAASRKPIRTPSPIITIATMSGQVLATRRVMDSLVLSRGLEAVKAAASADPDTAIFCIDSPDVEAAVRVRIADPYYDSESIDAIVRTESTNELLGARSVQAIDLAPRFPPERGAVRVVHMERTPAVPYDRGRPVLLLTAPAGVPPTWMSTDFRTMTVGGSADANGVLMFDDLPTGLWTISLHDGLGVSKAMEVVIRAGEVTDLAFSWPPLTGAAIFVLDDGSDRRLYGASVTFQRVESESISGPAGRNLPFRRSGFVPIGAMVPRSIDQSGGEGASGFLPLPAGHYRVIVVHTGYQTQDLEFEIVPEQIANWTVRMRRGQ